jgi:RNA polymerase sigma factor (sigma-70 family)
MSKIDIISSTSVDDAEENFLPFYLGNTPEEAEETYSSFSWLLSIMASNYATNTDILMEDYFAEAITGLARAKRDWDPTRGGCKFQTFAILKIKNALNEYYRKNSRIVNIPAYVRTAHTYITNIKTILEGYNMHPEGIKFVLEKDHLIKFGAMANKDFIRVLEELEKLNRLIRNCELDRINLIKRAEFVPSDMSYDESMTQEELYDRQRQRLAAALVVSKLEDSMTPTELHIAQGIMAGKTFAEIGRTHDPKRSIAWVQDRVNEMREKFKPNKKGS